MVGGTSHRNRIIEISVLGQIVVLFENVFLDGASRGATQQLSSTAGFAIDLGVQVYQFRWMWSFSLLDHANG